MRKSKLTKFGWVCVAVELIAGITAGKIADNLGKAFLGDKISNHIYKVGMLILDATVADYAMSKVDEVLSTNKAIMDRAKLQTEEEGAEDGSAEGSEI